MKKALLTIICAASMLTAQAQDYVQFLYDHMALPDKDTYPAEYWEANVAKTLEVREKMGWNVPEREFTHFVLPLRINNETLDNFRTDYADLLCERVSGMDMYHAALEINHWCHEMATYKPSDARTSGPEQTISRGIGRCGEESVLCVAALRAAGLPARQVYTPRWAHTDDNHAWVEVFIDGRWYFLGACEPEPRLNMGWFNAPVSRALLLHTRAIGGYEGDEDIIYETSEYTEINVTANYVPTRHTTVRVLDGDGNVVEGAKVEYKIYNYGEFYTVARYDSDKEGCVSLNTGKGDMLVWASKDGRFGFAVACGNDDSIVTDVVLEHNVGDEFGIDLDIVPPVEDPIPADATEEEIADNKARMAVEDSLRNARPKGNDEVINAFLTKYDSKKARKLLASLTEKDRGDVSFEVLEDAIRHCGRRFVDSRDCPRIELEALLPYFGIIGEGLEFKNTRQIRRWVDENITVDDAANPQRLRIPPVTVWKSRRADSFSKEVFFVALCRAKGFRARINLVTGDTEYGRSSRDMARLSVKYDSPIPTISDPEYYRHFTLSSIEDGRASLMNYDEDGDLHSSVLFRKPVKVEKGYYLMTSGNRMADGSVLAHMEFFNADGNVTVPVRMRYSEEEVSVLGSMDAEQKFLPDGSETEQSILSATGRGYFVIAVLGDGDEPTNHAVREFEAVAPELNEWSCKVVILSDGQHHIDALDNAVYGSDPDKKVHSMLTTGLNTPATGTLPVITVCDTFGRTVYYSQGYNTSLGEDLRKIIKQL